MYNPTCCPKWLEYMYVVDANQIIFVWPYLSQVLKNCLSEVMQSYFGVDLILISFLQML